MAIEVIEWKDDSGREMVWRFSGGGELKLGAQLVVLENQWAIFFRDGRALDTFGTGRHTLTTANIPLLTRLLGLPFGERVRLLLLEGRQRTARRALALIVVDYEELPAVFDVLDGVELDAIRTLTAHSSAPFPCGADRVGQPLGRGAAGIGAGEHPSGARRIRLFGAHAAEIARATKESLAAKLAVRHQIAGGHRLQQRPHLLVQVRETAC